MGKVSPSTAPVECHVCGTIISRRGDLQRHLNTHRPNKEALKHHCPEPGCDYKTLQLSNLKTHQRLHSGEKNRLCPDCDFRTADPASLTRHRKRNHDYVPAPRQCGKSRSSLSRSPLPTASKRHSPYSPRRFLSPVSSSTDFSAPSPKSLSSIEDFVHHSKSRLNSPDQADLQQFVVPSSESSEQVDYQSLFEAQPIQYDFSCWFPDAAPPTFYSEPYPMTICAPFGGEFHQQAVVDNSTLSYEDLTWNPELQHYLGFECQDTNPNLVNGFESVISDYSYPEAMQPQPNEQAACYPIDGSYFAYQPTFSPSWAEWPLQPYNL